jgi:hypothetical protein
VFSTPVEVPAAARARWLAEVAETLEQAEYLVSRLKVGCQHAGLIGELELRIRVAKGEVEALRASRPLRSGADPKWTGIPPWEETERTSA